MGEVREKITLDLMVDPVNQRLAGAHGDEQAYLVR